MYGFNVSVSTADQQALVKAGWLGVLRNMTCDEVSTTEEDESSDYDHEES